MKKVIVIGLDGLDPAIVERMLDAGQLHNLAGIVLGLRDGFLTGFTLGWGVRLHPKHSDVRLRSDGPPPC